MRRLVRRSRRLTVRKTAKFRGVSVRTPAAALNAAEPQKRLLLQSDNAKWFAGEQTKELLETKSAVAVSPEGITGAARALARLPRQKPARRWTGWLHGVHMWRYAPVVLPDGSVCPVYGILCGGVLVLKESKVDEFLPFEVFPAAQVQRYKNPDAVALGKSKPGVRERRSIKKLFACWRNVRQPVRPGSRPRGRPRASPSCLT